MELEGSLQHLQESPPQPVPVLSQFNSFPVFSSTSWISILIFLPSMLGFCRWSPSLRYPHQNPVCTSPLPYSVTCLTRLILLDLIPRIIFDDKYDLLGLGSISGADWSCNSIEDIHPFVCMLLHSGTETTFLWLFSASFSEIVNEN